MNVEKETSTVASEALGQSHAVTYTVFATREGLVGGTTANGHIIQPNDHFVALPSRRALSPKGSSQYSVRVANPRTGKIEVAPVWDIGPWNINDDYWNPSAQREAWKDLPQERRKRRPPTGTATTAAGTERDAMFSTPPVSILPTAPSPPSA